MYPSVPFSGLIKTKALRKGIKGERRRIRGRKKDRGGKNGRERGNHRH